MQREWALLPDDMELLRAVVAEVPLDPGFTPLVRRLQARGAEVTVLSDGFGFYVGDVCRPLGLPFLTNRVVDGRLEFSPRPPDCRCESCGTCKTAPVLEARRRGRVAVVVGDGPSDRFAAVQADIVFAKDSLAAWCAAHGVAFTPFESLADVDAAVRRLPAPPPPR